MTGRYSLSLWVGAAVTLAFVLLACVSFWWTPYDYAQISIVDRLSPPNTQFLLGTDAIGRDVLSRIMIGAQSSMAVALLAVGIGMGVGVPMGLLAAAMQSNVMRDTGGGVALVDDVVMRFADIIFAFPAIIIAILISALFGASAINAIIAVGIFNIPVFARVARGAALSLWTRDFILAARLARKSGYRISLEHILPNVLNVLIIQGTIQFSLGILAEAGLSYVGLGAQPPRPSWGGMLAEAQTMLAIAPHLVWIPGLSIVTLVLGLNLLGDGLRDYVDASMRANRL